MIRRNIAISAAALFLLLVSAAAAPQHASAASGLSLSLSHQYKITEYGYGVLNDTITFKNNGTSAVQIPTVHLGIPSSAAALASGFVLSNTQFDLSPQTATSSNGSALYAIAPAASAASLAAGNSTSVSLKTVMKDILNFTSQSNTANATAVVIVSPSLDTQVSSLEQSLELPSGGSFSTAPSGFQSTGSTNSTYTKTSNNVTPAASVQKLEFSDSDQGSFTPVVVPSLSRSIVPSANGLPQVQDTITVTNVASYTLNLLRVDLLDSNISTVTILPNTQPPLLNPQPISVSAGILTFTESPIGENLPAHSTITFTIAYTIPASMVKTSGNQVKVSIPYLPSVPAVVKNYTVTLASAKGVTPQAGSRITASNVSVLSPGTVDYAYSINIGWATADVIPAAFLIFSVAFVGIAVQRSRPSDEEGAEEEGKRREARSVRISDVIADFEEKFALVNQRFEELRSRPRGAVSRAEFEKIRQEFDSLRARALQTLAVARQDAGAGRQYELLVQVGEAERAEDRAEKDLLNLYSQYHGQRMNEETFKRLLPNYRKRVESSINRLSDLLNSAQKQGK